MGKELTRTGNAGLHKAVPALYAPTG
jgi:site-specific recombinase XerD